MEGVGRYGAFLGMAKVIGSIYGCGLALQKSTGVGTNHPNGLSHFGSLY